jgi:hypothetical protein
MVVSDHLHAPVTLPLGERALKTDSTEDWASPHWTPNHSCSLASTTTELGINKREQVMTICQQFHQHWTILTAISTVTTFTTYNGRYSFDLNPDSYHYWCTNEVDILPYESDLLQASADAKTFVTTGVYKQHKTPQHSRQAQQLQRIFQNGPHQKTEYIQLWCTIRCPLYKQHEIKWHSVVHEGHWLSLPP